MKISVLIEALQEVKDKYGDLGVTIFEDPGSSGPYLDGLRIEEYNEEVLVLSNDGYNILMEDDE